MEKKEFGWVNLNKQQIEIYVIIDSQISIIISMY